MRPASVFFDIQLSNSRACQDQKKRRGVLSDRPEFQKWDGCKWTDAETRGGLSFAGSGRGGFCSGKICISEINEETLHFLHFVQDNLP